MIGIRGTSHVLARAESSAGTQEIQAMLKAMHRMRWHHGTVPSFQEAAFQRYSQFEEDGILLLIFALIGEKSRNVVEVCCGDGRQSMSANLIINHGWRGLLFEGDASLVRAARSFYAARPECVLNQPTIRQAWITAEGINGLIAAEGYAGEVDLLSLDIDGNDYWVWKALDAISPRVCVFETHNIIPSSLSLTVPYDPQFKNRVPEFHSASLLAMTKLSRAKGYRLIGGHRLGFNAFFMRDDVGRDVFPEVPVEAVHDNPFTKWSQANRWPAVKDREWQEV